MAGLDTPASARQVLINACSENCISPGSKFPVTRLTRHWTSAPVRELTRVNCTPKFVVSKAVEAYDGATRGRIQSS